MCSQKTKVYTNSIVLLRHLIMYIGSLYFVFLLTREKLTEREENRERLKKKFSEWCFFKKQMSFLKLKAKTSMSLEEEGVTS